MFHFNDRNEILEKFEVVNEGELVFEGHLYKFTSRNENVTRGDFDNLICVTFRNEEERHNIDVYFVDDEIKYVETGYGLN